MHEEDLSYFENEEFCQLLQFYEDSLSHGRPIYLDADELTDIAEYYMVHDKEPMADQAIALAVELHPDSVDPQVFLSRQEMFHGNMERAHEICDAIRDQDDREVHLLRAELYIREELLDKADEVLMSAYEAEKGAQIRFAYDATCIFVDYMQWGYAQKWCDTVKSRNPHYTGLAELEAEIRIGCGDFDTAKEMLNEILDNNSYNTKAWMMLAEAHFSTEQFLDAVESCEFLLAINEHHTAALSLIAKCHFEMCDYAKANYYLQKLYNEDPHHLLQHMHAMCLFLLGEYEQAKENLQLAVSNIPEDEIELSLQITLLTSLIESKLKHPEEAISILKAAKDFIVKYRSVQEYELLCGQVLLENGNVETANQHFEEAMRQSDDSEKTALIIGISYFENNKFIEARNILSTLSENENSPIADHAQPYLAMCCMKLDDTDSYLSHLRTAVQRCPDVTEQLFEEYFPGVTLDEYYLYAHKKAYGFYPD